MSEFDNRERAFENKFAHDEEKKFKIAARRRKLLGLWAADVMCLNEAESLQYALEIVNFGIEDQTSGAVIKKIIADLKSKGHIYSEADIRAKNMEFEEIAAKQIASK